MFTLMFCSNGEPEKDLNSCLLCAGLVEKQGACLFWYRLRQGCLQHDLASLGLVIMSDTCEAEPSHRPGETRLALGRRYGYTVYGPGNQTARCQVCVTVKPLLNKLGMERVE